MKRPSVNLSIPPVGGKFFVGGGIVLLIALFFRPFTIVNAGERGYQLKPKNKAG